MEGQILFDAIGSEDSTLTLLKEYEDLFENGENVSDRVVYLINAAHLAKKLGLKRKALKWLETAEEAAPSSIKVLKAKARLLFEMGKSQETLEVCKHAVQSCTLATEITDLEEIAQLMAGPQRPATPPKTEAMRPTQEKVALPLEIDRTNCQLSSKDQYLMRKFPFLRQDVPQDARLQKLAQYLGIEKVKMIDHNGLMQKCIEFVNANKLDEALAVSTYLLMVTRDPGVKLSAYLARGSAFAMSENLRANGTRSRLRDAVDDFTHGLQIAPDMWDFHRRRGQSYVALDEHQLALEDFKKVLPHISGKEKGELLKDIATVHQKELRLMDALKALQEAAPLTDSAQVWNQLGLCRTSVGHLDTAIDAFKRAVRRDKNFTEAYLNLGQASKEKADPSTAKPALETAMRLDCTVKTMFPALKMLGQMIHGCGNHMEAAEKWTQALALDDLSVLQRVEAHFHRGVCYHGMGYHEKAVKDYREAYSLQISNATGLDFNIRRVSEVATFQFLAWYQEQLAKYNDCVLDYPVHDISLDRDITAEFKEAWCKKGPPPATLVLVQPSRASMPAAPDAAKIIQLQRVAEPLGSLIQYSHQGFLPNKRQQLMAGLAIIEGGQFIRRLVEAKRSGVEVPSYRGASRGPQSHPVGWRDFQDIHVKWRQLSEPNDQVVWVDLLTEREFSQGFGSHTPIFSGQTQCVRYFMNFERAFQLFKEQVARDGYVFNSANHKVPLASPTKQEDIKQATTAWELYQHIHEDCWVVVHIKSAIDDAKQMEGTRLTLVRVPDQPEAVEFSIRTPVTPERWKEFDEELTELWNNVLDCLVNGSSKSETADAILKYAFFWYNFMPLARGNVAVGYITILSMFLAAGMPVTSSITKGVQTDWEAILAPSADDFIKAVSPWLYPAATRGLQESGIMDPLKNLPELCETLLTARHRLEALNGPHLDPLPVA